MSSLSRATDVCRWRTQQDVYSESVLLEHALCQYLSNLFCGCAGDAASKWAPNYGRILVAQFSVLLSLPLSVLLLKGLPTRGAPDMEAHSNLYGFIIFFFGLMISW